MPSKRKLTKFGRLVKIILTYNKITVSDMARDLGTSKNNLVFLQYGKTKLTLAFFEKFISKFGHLLPISLIHDLRDTIPKISQAAEAPSVKLRIRGSKGYHKKFFRFLIKAFLRFGRAEEFEKLRRYGIQLLKDRYDNFGDKDAVEEFYSVAAPYLIDREYLSGSTGDIENEETESDSKTGRGCDQVPQDSVELQEQAEEESWGEDFDRDDETSGHPEGFDP